MYFFYRTSTIVETALHDKWLEIGHLFTYKSHEQSVQVVNEQNEEQTMVIDQMKITLGPFLLGTCLSFFSLLIEILKIGHL